ncbi:hybrid sensor histidine kinase/response regulator, partial [Bacteroides cellulosilyticus]
MLKPVITILLYLFTPMLFGQSLINMKHYSVQDGLSQKNVHNFIQDDNGYIWMSTWNGLERFDGYSFYNYKTYPESPIRISNHRFTKIKKSSLNNIWCLTYDKRCYLFNTRTYEYQDPFLFNKSLTNSVSKLYALGKGITWAVGMQNELYRIDENKFPATESVELYSGRNERDTIYGITQDKDGDEWILTNKGALIVGQKSISNLMPFEFMVEIPGGIYLATSKGFFTRYDTQSQDVLPCVPEQPISEITGLKSLADNKIVILQNRSIILYDPANEKFTVHEMPIEIDSDVFEDKKGNLWLLGVNDGVILLDKENKNTTLLNYPRYPEVPFYKPCTFVHEDEYGCIWLKPAGGELCFYNPVNRCLEQASTYEMGMRKPVSFQAFSYIIARHQ